MNREREEKPDKLEFPSLTPSSIFSPLSTDATARCFPRSTTLVLFTLYIASSLPLPFSLVPTTGNLFASLAVCFAAASSHPLAPPLSSRLSRSRHFSLRLFSRTFAPCRLISRYKLVRATRNERGTYDNKKLKSEIITTTRRGESMTIPS